MKHLLTLALTITAGPLLAQPPALSPTPANPAQPGLLATSSITESSRLARVMFGPDGRPQAFLLRNRTFVTLTLGLTQQLPLTMPRNLALSVRGPAFGKGGDKTIQAEQITIAGVSYDDAPGRVARGVGVAPPPRPSLPPSPSPSAGPRALPPPVPDAPGVMPPRTLPGPGHEVQPRPAGVSIAHPPAGAAQNPNWPPSLPPVPDETAPAPPNPAASPKS